MQLKTNLLTVVAATAALCSSFAAWGTYTAPLRYKADGTFRIAQLADVHWGDTLSKECPPTLRAMQAVYDQAKPDFVVLTGDNVVDDPIMQGWETIIAFLEKQKVPYTVAMGNHDCEYMKTAPEFATLKLAYADSTGWDDDAKAKDIIYTRLMKSPYYVGDKGNQVSGYGNLAIPVYGPGDSEKVENVIYVFDSHDYPKNPFDGYYDWIHTDQVQWYNDMSHKYTAANGGTPVPSLAYFHIPLQEFGLIRKNPSTYGNMLEADAPGDVNTGLFGYALENGDIIGFFVGHDHSNDFVGVDHRIAMGYGRCSGYNAYGELERGGRIVDLNQGQRVFSTHVVTPSGKEPTLYLPHCITDEKEAKATYSPAIPNANPKRNGVAYKYFEGPFLQVSDVVASEPKAVGTMDSISITGAAQHDHFGYEFDALFNAEQKAIYQFKVFSDDGSQLYIDDQLVVDLDGSHSMRLGEGEIALEPGFHRLRLVYFDDYMGEGLGLWVGGRHMVLQPMPAELLFIPE